MEDGEKTVVVALNRMESGTHKLRGNPGVSARRRQTNMVRNRLCGACGSEGSAWRDVPCPIRMGECISREFPQRQRAEKGIAYMGCAMMRCERRERGSCSSTRHATSQSSLRPEKTEAEAERKGLPLATKILGARWPEKGLRTPAAKTRKGLNSRPL